MSKAQSLVKRLTDVEYPRIVGLVTYPLRKDYAASNLSLVRKIALNLLRQLLTHCRVRPNGYLYPLPESVH